MARVINFPKLFDSNSEGHLSIGRFMVGPIENPFVVRYTLAPNGNLILVMSENCREFLHFSPPYQETFGWQPPSSGS